MLSPYRLAFQYKTVYIHEAPYRELKFVTFLILIYKEIKILFQKIL